MRTEQLTKCSEPLQKLRSRFGTHYTGLITGGASYVVLCFLVSVSVLFHLLCVLMIFI